MRRYIPALVLFVLAPLMAEVLFGATPFSRIGGLVVVGPLYGCGAVLIRELAKRRDSVWLRIGLLAAAYGIVEEGLAIQSMFNPDLFNAGLLGGRALGVNWVWSEWTLGYHVVWSIILPIVLAELLFPARRSEPWLGRIGLFVVGIVYLLAVVALGAIFRLAVAPEFRAAPGLLIAAALVAAMLAALALARPRSIGQAAEATRHAPAPWVVGLVTLLAAVAWFMLLGLPQVLRGGAIVLAPMAAELALAAAVAALIRRWSASADWSDLHRLAVVIGALVVSMGVGFFAVTASNPTDQLGQGAASLIALVLLFVFAARLRLRSQAAQPAPQLG